MQSKGLSRVFSNTTVQKHQYFGAEPSSQSNLLGSWNGKQESRIAVAKRQGREKPAKIEQRKVKGRSKDLSEDLR